MPSPTPDGAPKSEGRRASSRWFVFGVFRLSAVLDPPPSLPTRMSALEMRASASLASIFALRMLGLFLILPVFAVYARSLPGGESATMIGMAMGIYGLTQGMLQIPVGILSDRIGRKPVMIVGLVLFAAGSFVAAFAHTLAWIIVGRAIQGSGAISAAVTAMIADATRDEHRTKAMAMVGGSIGLTFAGSMVLAPVFYHLIGMNGIFALTGILAVLAIGVVRWIVPDVARIVHNERLPFREVLLDRQLLRLNLGIFVLHVTQMAMFVVVPVLLVEGDGLPVAEHWKIYLPVVIASFAVMVPMIIAAERHGLMKRIFMFSIALLCAVQVMFSLVSNVAWIVALLFAFFVAFNVLEATLPSIISRVVHPSAKGAALGVYNTTQAIGVSVGGLLGGWVAKNLGRGAVFETTTVLVLIWLIAAIGLRIPMRRAKSKE